MIDKWKSYSVVKIEEYQHSFFGEDTKQGGIAFSNGETIKGFHDRESLNDVENVFCENIYVDWMQVDESFKTDVFTGKPVIELVKDYGIRINGYSFPAYDVQSGYYSSNLKLILSYENEDLDICDYTKKCRGGEGAHIKNFIQTDPQK